MKPHPEMDDLDVEWLEMTYGQALAHLHGMRIDDPQYAAAVDAVVALRRLRRTVLVGGGHVRCCARVNGRRCMYGEGHGIAEHRVEE